MINPNQQNTEDNMDNLDNLIIKLRITMRIAFALIMLLSAAYIAVDVEAGAPVRSFVIWGFNIGASFAALCYSFEKRS